METSSGRHKLNKHISDLVVDIMTMSWRCSLVIFNVYASYICASNFLSSREALSRVRANIGPPAARQLAGNTMFSAAAADDDDYCVS